jgi:hypothetical protein
MNAQLNHMLARGRTAELRGKPRGLRNAVVFLGGVRPSTHLYPFDGSVWLRDGSPIAAQTTPTYIPTAADVGHQIACRATVTYPLPFQLTATATSQAITIRAALPPPPPSTPALSALNVSPRTFTFQGRRVGGRCQPATRSNRRHRRCTRLALLPGTIALAGVASVNSLTLPGEIGGHTLEPGSYCLLATHALDGRAGNQRQTTFQITR